MKKVSQNRQVVKFKWCLVRAGKALPIHCEASNAKGKTLCGLVEPLQHCFPIPEPTFVAGVCVEAWDRVCEKCLHFRRSRQRSDELERLKARNRKSARVRKALRKAKKAPSEVTS